MKDGQEFRVIDENCWSPEARLADMDKTGMWATVKIIQTLWASPVNEDTLILRKKSLNSSLQTVIENCPINTPALIIFVPQIPMDVRNNVHFQLVICIYPLDNLNCLLCLQGLIILVQRTSKHFTQFVLMCSGVTVQVLSTVPVMFSYWVSDL